MRRRRAAWAAAFLAAAALLSGCGGPSENQLAAAREAERERAFDELDDRPVWVGTVVAFEDTYYDPITFDYGGRYPTSIDVARIAAFGDENCEYGRSGEYTRAFTAFLASRARPGTRLALVRAQDRGGYLERKGFLHTVRPDGTPDTGAPSINEQMVAAGVARPDPAVALREGYGGTADGVAEELDRQRREMTPVDFGYWSAFVAAHQGADRARAGIAGDCADHQIRERDRRERDRRESEENSRRMELGPDGRRGTADDYTDLDGDGRPDVGDGSGGGGGFDVPDGLCPTRFC